MLGRTRWLRWQVPYGAAMQFVPPDQLVARAPSRAVLRFRLADEAQGLVQRPVDELEVPVRVAYPVDPHAPTFAGVALDADRRTPLAGADETKAHEYPVRFTEQLLAARAPADPDAFRHASPAAVAVVPLGTSPRASGAKGPAAAAPVVRGVTLGGSESVPVLGILGRVPAGNTWAQFVVDSAGRVEPASISLPPGTDAAATTAVQSMLPRVRFSPPRAAGRATCEMLRMQVTFSAR